MKGELMKTRLEARAKFAATLFGICFQYLAPSARLPIWCSKKQINIEKNIWMKCIEQSVIFKKYIIQVLHGFSLYGTDKATKFLFFLGVQFI